MLSVKLSRIRLHRKVVWFGKRGLIYFCVIIFSLSLISCAQFKPKSKPNYWNPQQGTVILSATDKPISFATVLAIWKGKYEKESGGTQPICYHIEVAKTNKDGEFTISGWKQNYDTSYIRNKNTSLIVYKPGYWAKKLEYKQPNDGQHIYQLERISKANKQRTSKHRLNYLQRLVAKTSCDLRGDGRNKLRQVYFDILKEASQVAKTQNDKKKLASLKIWTSFVDN